jgi:hypothetical protein
MMTKATPFKPDKDLAPIPFDMRVCEMARALKEAGLPWHIHVGCFVWDPENLIVPPSPFPNRIYFILNIHRFLEIFGSIEAMKNKLVWLPTWHQARQLCEQFGIDDDLAGFLSKDPKPSPDMDLLHLYEQLSENRSKFFAL